MNARLEAFCDGVFAIAITLLIIDVKLPSTESLHTTREVWVALKDLSPSFLVFLLSFTIIFITWVNHHAVLKLVHKSSPRFIYANGLLLLTVVVVPFPTSLLGEFILTDHAAPAVILYSSVFAMQALAWNFLGRTALNPSNPLTNNEKARLAMVAATRKSHYALTLYTIFAILAIWFPLTIAIIVAASWIAWLIIGININEK